jgi:hypothetical protein
MAWRSSRLANAVCLSSVSKSGTGQHKHHTRRQLLLEILDDVGLLPY